VEELKDILGKHDVVEHYSTNPDTLFAENRAAYDCLYSLDVLYRRGLEAGQLKHSITDWLAQTHGTERWPKEQLYSIFTAAIVNARKFLSYLLYEFIPQDLRFPFSSDGVASPTTDPAELLQIIWQPMGNPRLHSYRTYEAFLTWVLGRRYMWMWQKVQPIASRLRDLTLCLEERLFTGNGDQPRKEIITSFCDVQNAYRWSSTPTAHCVNHLVSTRSAEINGRPCKVLYDGRVKDEQSVFRKCLVKGVGAEYIGNDYCAVTLVTFSAEDYHALRRRLREEIFPDGALVGNLRVNGKSHVRNAFSSDLYWPEEQFIGLFQGQFIEVQLFLYPPFFNRLFSAGEENHYSYRLKQVWPLLQLFFPTEHYLIEWNEMTYGRLKALQLGRILTCIQPTE